jgi:hypothetical protein
MSSTPANQDPALAPPPPATAPPAGAPASDSAASPHLLDSAQIVQLLRHFPSVYQVSLPSIRFPPFRFLFELAASPAHACTSRVERYRISVFRAPPRDSGRGHGWGTFARQSGADRSVVALPAQDRMWRSVIGP